jgi:hypothetical protein
LIDLFPHMQSAANGCAPLIYAGSWIRNEGNVVLNFHALKGMYTLERNYETVILGGGAAA